MNRGSTRRPIYLVIISLMTILACNLPAAAPTVIPSIAPASGSPAPSIPTPTVAPVTHLISPVNTNPGGNYWYDTDSSGTGSQHRAPYGDAYDLNFFERPFTQKDMTYLPNVDINTFRIVSDGTWYYVFIKLIGTNPNDPINIDYGVELNKNKDGFGDTLLWAHPPYATQWTTNGVKVFLDPNHDTGGALADKSDAKPGAPYPGDGYETVIFDAGQGKDPDLAWVRIDPQDSSLVEFAFKNSLAGPSFLWGAWADAGLKDPSKFNYNDRFTLAEAGSPIAKDPNYPVKAIYAVDNTCWAPFGFKPAGYETRICPVVSSPVKKPPHGTDQPGPSPVPTQPPIP